MAVSHQTATPCRAKIKHHVPGRNYVLAANPEFLALHCGITDWPADRRNTIRYLFIHPAARLLFGDWHGGAAGAVANLRTIQGYDPNAADLTALVDELTQDSREFARVWAQYDVTPRRSKPKVFHHPIAGDLSLWHEVLRLSDEGQRLGIYQATPGTPDHDSLLLLAMTAGEAEHEQAGS